MNTYLNKKNIIFIAIAIALFWSGYYIKNIFDFIILLIGLISPIIIAVCIAFILNVFYKAIEGVWNKLFKESNYKVKKVLCVLLTYILFFLVLFILSFMIIPEFARSFVTLTETIPQHLVTLEQTLKDFLASFNISIEQLPINSENISNINREIANFFSERASVFISRTLDITTSIFGAITTFIIAFALSVYMLYHKDKLNAQMGNIINALFKKEHAKQIFKINNLSITIFNNFISGQLLEACIIGLLCFIGMSIFGFPYATVISTLVGFTALIPVVGAFLGTAVGAVLIFIINPIQALWFIIFIIILQQVEGNLIYPKVVGKSVGLPGLWVLIAITIGANIGGITGMLLSVPLASILYTLFKEYIQERLKRKKIPIINSDM